VKIDAGVTTATTNADRDGRESSVSTLPCGTRRRAPRNATVSIKSSSDDLSYAEIIKYARENVNLKDLGIVNLRMRRAANGGVLIEISGSEGTIKVDLLA